jgi:hypothetical protein
LTRDGRVCRACKRIQNQRAREMNRRRPASEPGRERASRPSAAAQSGDIARHRVGAVTS